MCATDNLVFVLKTEEKDSLSKDLIWVKKENRKGS